MTDTVGRYAQLAVGSNQVDNVIIMPSTFTLEGYTFKELASGQSCQAGAYFNESDGNYYIDSEFVTLVSEQTSETEDTSAAVTI